MEGIGKKEDISGFSIEKQEQMVSVAETVPFTQDSLNEELSEIDLKINNHEEVVSNIIQETNNIRRDLGLSGERTDLHSIESDKKEIIELKNKRDDLKQRLKDLLAFNVSHAYSEQLTDIAQEKIKWINSPEFDRRLRLTKATDAEVLETKKALIENIYSGKPIILPQEKFKEMTNILSELTGTDINIAEGFNIDREKDKNVPENLEGSIVIKEYKKIARPPVPGREINPHDQLKDINKNTVHHEMGHLAQDGLLQGELYKGIHLQTKENSPDPEYIGSIIETDTRIRSMFRDLKDVFDPEKEAFGEKHIEILKEKLKKRELSGDTKDLLDHYNDTDLINFANNLPAI